MFTRIATTQITNSLLNDNKAIILYGARQVGKTTLIKDILAGVNGKILAINADEQRFIDILSSRDSRKLAQLVSGYDVLFIDEAQRVPDIGINLKILTDSFPDLTIIATGSSSFELANRVNEPLTGRKVSYTLFPIALCELAQHYTPFELSDQLEERLIWGCYPDIITQPLSLKREQLLRELSGDYLYKDILQINDIRNPDTLRLLLKLLAFQIGNMASLNELAQKLSVSKETVARYLDILEKSFIIFKLQGFSRNLRNELTKMHKYYFYDLGFRNMLIENLNPLDLRNDHGALWENFLISERLKYNHYHQHYVSSYFWRTYGGAEIDYVEEDRGMLNGFEIKYSTKKARIPKTWINTYPEATWKIINRDNWGSFVMASD